MMHVLKRDGRKGEAIKFDKITARIQKLCYGLSPLVDPVAVAMRVIEGLYDGVTTSELDSLAAETAASMTVRHPDFRPAWPHVSLYPTCTRTPTSPSRRRCGICTNTSAPKRD